MAKYVIGVDVGTGSVRGALVNVAGKICRIHTSELTTWNPKADFYLQSSDEIWDGCCRVIKNLVKDIDCKDIEGLAFDATCSLVVCDNSGKSVSVDPSGDDNQNVILWMDHRAITEANIINRTKHPVLRYVGGNVSPEMMVPRILWLKRNNLRCWQRAAHFFLLPDFLSWKATGEDSRSLCSVVCKCNYEGSNDGNSGWTESYFNAVGLRELAEDGWKKIGSKIINPGELCGNLSKEAAQRMSLFVGTPVAASLIDAHAGGLGVIGCKAKDIPEDFISRSALISGTSTCHMFQMREKRFVTGVWGPYFSAMIPDLWLLEGGQSASGKLIDYIVETHPISKSIRAKYPNTMTEYLNNCLYKMAEDARVSSVDELTEEIHLYPDFHGNRSPLADPKLRGMILGLTLETNENNLTLLYLATIQALAYGTKHILEEIERRSATDEKVKAVLICGGLSKNEIFLQTHANVIGLPVLVPDEAESVLLGSAMLAASVSGFYPDLKEAAINMAGAARLVNADLSVERFHNKKYAAYFKLLECQRKIRELMM